MSIPHPCPFPDSTVTLIGQYLPPSRYPTVLDPFSGIGRIHLLPNTTVGIEIEREWADQIPENSVNSSAQILGSALHLPFPARHFSAAATSPCFGNRMADHHNAQDGSPRNTYRHKLGRELSPNSSASMQWGAEYRAFHYSAWIELTRVVRVGGRLVLNIKNHIRAGEIQRVAEWHLTTIIPMGWRLHALDTIPAPGNRFGANYDLRVDHEFLAVFDRTRP